MAELAKPLDQMNTTELRDAHEQVVNEMAPIIEQEKVISDEIMRRMDAGTWRNDG